MKCELQTQYSSVTGNTNANYLKKEYKADRDKTLSLDGEKLTAEVGAECCFSQEAWKMQKGYLYTLKVTALSHIRMKQGQLQNLSN